MRTCKVCNEVIPTNEACFKSPKTGEYWHKKCYKKGAKKK